MSLAIGFLALTSLALPALAESQEQDNMQMPSGQMQPGQGGMMSGGKGMMGDHTAMMQMMMQMHGQMMGGGMMGSGMKGGMDGGMHGQGMKGGMHGQGKGAPRWLETFDADGDGILTEVEIAAGMAQLLETYDTDGNGNLSIAEFEVLHSAQNRERMVDRFQHIDADGDGAVTPDEMNQAANRMARHAGGQGSGQRGGMMHDQMGGAKTKN
jgi:Ca2+-binding EF-hand superfamily protein